VIVRVEQLVSYLTTGALEELAVDLGCQRVLVRAADLRVGVVLVEAGSAFSRIESVVP
jgi:hypothetical protein